MKELFRQLGLVREEIIEIHLSKKEFAKVLESHVDTRDSFNRAFNYTKKKYGGKVDINQFRLQPQLRPLHTFSGDANIAGTIKQLSDQTIVIVETNCFSFSNLIALVIIATLLSALLFMGNWRENLIVFLAGILTLTIISIVFYLVTISSTERTLHQFKNDVETMVKEYKKPPEFGPYR